MIAHRSPSLASSPPRRALSRVALPTVALLAVALFPSCSEASGIPTSQNPNLFVVKHEDLPITVRENAEMQALRETIVRSEVEGQSTIIFIVPEGTVVKQGEKLVELDVSELMEKASTQEISVEKARSALEQARTQQSILEKELTTKRNTAASELQIARMELEKLLGAKGGSGSEGKNSDMVKRLQELVSRPDDDGDGEALPATSPGAEPPAGGPAATTGGPAAPTAAPAAAGPQLVTRVNPRNYAGLVDKVQQLLQVKLPDGTIDSYERDMGAMANQILQQADKIRLAMASLKVKEDTVLHSRRLAGKQFITRSELERDELDYQSQVSQVTIAWNDLELLVNYTLQKDRIKMTQDYENALLELERVEASNEAERKSSEFDVDAKAKEFTLAKERLDNMQRQIKSRFLLAPTPGTVVYAKLDRGRGGEAVREGVQVRERQELIILPDTTKMRCIVKVQEAQVDKVRRGQAAFVTVDGLQGEMFRGVVTSVAPVADSNSNWSNSDRKVYTTIVELEGDNPDGRLRSRMASNVVIAVETVKDTLPVPLQAVFRERSVNYVWKQTPDGPQATRVKVGRQNTERVEILEGLAAEDVLHLTPPAGVPMPKFEQPVAPEPNPIKEAAAPAAAPAAPAAGAPPGESDNPSGGPQRGNRAGGGPGGAGMAWMNKKLPDMTPEEIESYKGSLSMMERMLDGLRERGDAETVTQVETALAGVRAALDKQDLAAAQTHRDALTVLRRKLMPPRGNGGTEGGERPRRGDGGGGGRRGEGGGGDGGGRRGGGGGDAGNGGG